MVKSNSNNPVVKKEELIDILYQKNIEDDMTMTQLISKKDISNIIDANIELDDKNDGIECFEELLKNELMKKVPNHVDVIHLLKNSYFNKTYYFKIDDNRYIYFYLEQGKEEDFIEQIDYILNNNLNEGKNNNFLKYLKSQYVKQLEFDKALNNNKSIDDKFKEYDCIKVICENSHYNDIGIKDIAKCREFLDYHEKNHKYLTIEEQILLRLIILYGIKNVYLNNSDYYKKVYIEIIDYAIKNINDYILFIKENMFNIKNEYKYSFNNEYRINILQKFLPIFLPNKEWWEIPDYEHTDKKGNIPFIFLLRYINFDYYVSNMELEDKKFEESIKKFENAIKVKKMEEKKEIFKTYEFEAAIKQFKEEIIIFENAIEDKKFEEIKNIFEKAKKAFEAKEFEESLKQFKEAIIIFENAIEVKQFEEAKKIYEMNLPLFSFFKEESENSKEKWFMIAKLLFDININPLLLLGSDNSFSYSYDVIDKIYIDPQIKRNIKVMLKFYMSCYYYFKHFKDIENANKVYEFLLYFRRGYDIDDFIIKCKYIKMAEDICNLKIDNDKKNDNDKKIDEAVEFINNKITEMNIINKFDIDDVKELYPHIKFDNLDQRVKTYIATGDKIINTFDNDKSTKFDYSSAVIEWSKAVELEINNKFISKISKYKYDIEKYSRQINPNKDGNFVLDTKNATIGLFYAIKKYKLQDHLYDEYFKKLYTFDKETYNELCQYIRDICETRNDSAHKEKPINVVTATECKDKILKVNKILEILSELEKR